MAKPDRETGAQSGEWAKHLHGKIRKRCFNKKVRFKAKKKIKLCE